MSRRFMDVAILLLAPALAGCFGADGNPAGSSSSTGQTERPNILLILTDNQGAWTLGCYGNPDIRTPHLDRLAAQGVRFDRAFACNAVCSPTRASLLTGLIPSQHGVHRYLAAGGAQTGPGAYDTLEEFPTLPKILAADGYDCGLIGKWHLGANATPRAGFSTWVTMPHGHTQSFHNNEILENGATRKEPGYLTEYWTRRAVEFLERHRARPFDSAQGKPFFLMLAYNGPYGLANVMRENPPAQYLAPYEGSAFASFPRGPAHPWLRAHQDLLGDPEAIRNFAGHVTAVDTGAGEVLDALDRLGLSKNTLVIFTSDQGSAAGQGGFWGMGDHTRPLSCFDPMIRIPLILRHPGRIPAGRVADRVVATYDILPSVLAHAGLTAGRPSGPAPPPGRDFTPLLTADVPGWEDAAFFEFENVRAIRTDRWKYVERFHETPNELYDLDADPGEAKNLADDPARAATREALAARLKAFFDKHADPKWDLWKGGGSKTQLLRRELFGLPDISEGRGSSPAR